MNRNRGHEPLQPATDAARGGFSNSAAESAQEASSARNLVSRCRLMSTKRWGSNGLALSLEAHSVLDRVSKL